MASSRSRRAVKVPQRYEGDEMAELPSLRPETATSPPPRRAAVKYVYRLLRPRDIRPALQDRAVWVLWPEEEALGDVAEDSPKEAAWYLARVDGVDSEAGTGTLYYEESDELEEGASLRELAEKGHLAAKEPRAAAHRLTLEEVSLDAPFVGRSLAERLREGEPSEEEEGEEGEEAETKTSQGTKRARAMGSDGDDDSEGGEGDSDAEDALSGAEEPAGEPARRSRRSGARRAKKAVAGFYGATSPGDDFAPAPASGPGEEELREMIRAKLRDALELAAGEAGDADSAGEAGDADVAGESGVAAVAGSPSELAAAVEQALHDLFGGVTRDYKGKFRSLHFNLKDPHNPELRASVLLGRLGPAQLVRLSPSELASRELADYRRRKEEEALKMAVLDAEAAAKFSTAAALDAKLESAASAGGLPAKRPAIGAPAGKAIPPEAPELAEESESEAGSASDSPGPDAEPSPGLHREPSGGLTPRAPPPLPEDRSDDAADQPAAAVSPRAGRPPAPAIDWASIKAATLQEAHEEEGEGAEETGQEPDEAPEPAPPPQPSPTPAHPLSHLFARSPLRSEPSRWRGSLAVPGSDPAKVEVHGLAGSGAGSLPSVLRRASALHTRGRVSSSALARFLEDLRRSKHREATLALVLGRPDPRDPDAVSKDARLLRAAAAGLAARARAAVGDGGAGEVYLLPRGEVADQVLAAARLSTGARMDGPGWRLAREGAGVPPDGLLALLVHRRGWEEEEEEEKGGGREEDATKRQEEGGRDARHKNTAPPMPANPGLPASVAEGIDWNALTALAASLGLPAAGGGSQEPAGGGAGAPPPPATQAQAPARPRRKSRWDSQPAPPAPEPGPRQQPSAGWGGAGSLRPGQSYAGPGEQDQGYASAPSNPPLPSQEKGFSGSSHHNPSYPGQEQGFSGSSHQNPPYPGQEQGYSGSSHHNPPYPGQEQGYPASSHHNPPSNQYWGGPSARGRGRGSDWAGRASSAGRGPYVGGRGSDGPYGDGRGGPPHQPGRFGAQAPMRGRGDAGRGMHGPGRGRGPPY